MNDRVQSAIRNYKTAIAEVENRKAKRTALERRRSEIENQKLSQETALAECREKELSAIDAAARGDTGRDEIATATKERISAENLLAQTTNMLASIESQLVKLDEGFFVAGNIFPVDIVGNTKQVVFRELFAEMQGEIRSSCAAKIRQAFACFTLGGSGDWDEFSRLLLLMPVHQETHKLQQELLKMLE